MKYESIYNLPTSFTNSVSLDITEVVLIAVVFRALSGGPGRNVKQTRDTRK